jgi:hypothetical protein
MDSTSIPEYLAEGAFRIYDWREETLLLRRQGSLYIGGDVDWVFWGVKYLDLTVVLRGVRVWRPRDREALLCERKYAPDPFAEPGSRVYGIESEGARFYVIASNCWVLTNRTHVSESPLPYLTSQVEKARESYFREHATKWYTIG